MDIDKLQARLSKIGELLHTQDNRITADPMFCVQIKVRDIGYDTDLSDGLCWVEVYDREVVIYDDDVGFKTEPKGDEWEEYGYKDRWETVMVAFTEKGCEDYLKANGHNVRRRAHNGQVRIYADSFYRCEEMLTIRAYLMGIGKPETQHQKEYDTAL
jgi:hypothetical protein